MQTTLPISRQKLMELLRLTPEASMREGFVMAFLNAVDDYVWALLNENDEPGNPRSC